MIEGPPVTLSPELMQIWREPVRVLLPHDIESFAVARASEAVSTATAGYAVEPIGSTASGVLDVGALEQVVSENARGIARVSGTSAAHQRSFRVAGTFDHPCSEYGQRIKR